MEVGLMYSVTYMRLMTLRDIFTQKENVYVSLIKVADRLSHHKTEPGRHTALKLYCINFDTAF